MTTAALSGVFSGRRHTGRLLLRDLAYGYRGLLVAVAAVAGGIIVFSAIGALIMSARGVPEGTVQGNGYFGFFQGLLLPRRVHRHEPCLPRGLAERQRHLVPDPPGSRCSRSSS